MDFQSSQNAMYDPSNFIDPSAMSANQMNGARPYPMSSIPQKRDSTGATMSRSQTPSQQFQQGFAQQGFAHTPSPTMQNQHFRPSQMPPQRMQTASPAQNPHAPQMSPMGFAQGSPMGQGLLSQGHWNCACVMFKGWRPSSHVASVLASGSAR